MRHLGDTTEKPAGKYSKPERLVKDKKGKPITEIQKRRNRWLVYFGELLNRSATMNQTNIETTHADFYTAVAPPMIEEIRVTIRQINSWKAAEPYNISTEVLKLDIEASANILLVLFRKICEKVQLPTDWKEGYRINIQKKGISQQV